MWQGRGGGGERTAGGGAAKVDEGPGVLGGQPDAVAGLEVAVGVAGHVHDLQLLRDVHNDLQARHKVRVLPRDVLAQALAPLGDDHRW